MSIDNKRVRGWCFTLNNYTAEDVTYCRTILGKDAAYLVAGNEVGESKTRHIQGYVEFKNARRGSAMRKLFGGRAHWEVRRGTFEQASNYCKKEGDFFEMGKLPAQGERTDLDDVADLVEEGATIKEIACSHPTTFIKYHKGIAALKAAMYEHRSVAPKVIWRWGLAGSGKTLGAASAHPSHYIKDGTQWWDGYEQQPAIIIDDFDGRWPFRDLLRLLDRYQYQGQFKGGYIPINSPFIYITCEFPPEQLWVGNELAQVVRRLSEVIEVKLPSESPASTGIEPHGVLS
jgi:hypothetical protein